MADFKPKARDPLHEPGEGSLVGQFGAEGGCVRARGDFAVVELCAQRSVCLAGESDLVDVWRHWAWPRSRWLTVAASVPGGGGWGVTRFRVITRCDSRGLVGCQGPVHLRATRMPVTLGRAFRSEHLHAAMRPYWPCSRAHRR